MFNKIESGKNIPHNIYVIIEIPYGNNNIKYEISKKNSLLYVDRFIKNTVYYPFNYGYINKTISSDNDNLDVIIPINYKINIGTIILCKPIGIIKMYDNNIEDNKIIALPDDSISDEFKDINNISDISKDKLYKINFFLNNYKTINNKSLINILEYGNNTDAKKEIILSIKKFKKNNNNKNEK
ncbi:inorganic diphosphatase [Candidatus Nardonella dryophthoridicola]|uniref:inorganic diphosphatase n=1 Tax=Candidatus Nardonella dryophthoridicola TaxID=1971485 RepID=UPI001AD86ACB|nr:inorganic diphosphatase [Candidatus Nardonella dryophthoridicola]QTJ62786.1 inorganic diphosphatase [Candidatus Nardonella dryophthoridicola]